jgi:TM2 domain-containing membrane protein YozV
MSETPSQYGPADPTQRFDPAAQPASPPPQAPTSGQPGSGAPYADPTQPIYSTGPGATPAPPTYTTPPAPEYGSNPGYYPPASTPPTPAAPESWGQQQAPGYPPPETPGYPTSGGAAGYPTSGGAAYGYQQAGYQQAGYQQQGPYPQQAGYPATYQQPGQQPMYDAQGRPLSDKSKLVAGLLGIFLGGFGVGRFYTGHVLLGVIQLVVSVCTLGVGAIWGLVDGIIILVNGGTDAQGRVLRD